MAAEQSNGISHLETMSVPRVLIDGSIGEGGGQVLRNAIAYAAILRKELEIEKIRARRTQPGLKAQHMTGMQLVSHICGGNLTGDQLHSMSVRYTPSMGKQGEFNVEKTCVGDTKTAGSICLLLQAALPCALFGAGSPCNLILKGGTNATLAPQYDYFTHVFRPTLRDRLGIPDDVLEANLIRRGYYPRGGGEVHIKTKPWSKLIPPITLKDRGEVCDVYIRSFSAGKVPVYVAEKMAKSAKNTLKTAMSGIDPRLEVVFEKDAIGSGSGLIIVAKTSTGCVLAGSALGSPKKRAQDVGVAAANELILTLKEGGCVDEWLQDQLILFMALGDGVSEIVTGSLTLHTQTAISVAEQMSGATFEVSQMSPDFESSSEDGKEFYGQEGRIAGKHLIRCRGISFRFVP